MQGFAWVKPAGAEYASVETGAGWLRASGVAVAGGPLPYHSALPGPAPRFLHPAASAGGDPATLTGALDCDLGLSPLTNTMPVLRHGLLAGGGPVDLVMAWVSVPDLSVHRDAQRYTFVRPAAHSRGGAIINYSSDGFSADITFDTAGLVVDYPGIGTRV